ncbi:ParB domain protein nuclease [Acidithiobacillus ferrivorans SS3]|uniref:ParB domain protein nuclease n=1 Tax=Acidithiobacillus ferrivorans SS3 TaxID=743299 RepID=G0JL16_9PROT|nr:ParB N-terminal domain-containing protein [Acidithiobacillus ferrivorans]AEM48013.1 ParB domain protein nuclease [Acidithiobacillus ferrivorans SS3]
MSNTKDMSMSNEMLEELTGLAQVQAVLGESTVDVGFKRVPLGKIVVDSEQPRKLLIEQSDDNVGQSQSASLIELRDSIVVHGILQPISVEKLKDQTGGVKYKIVFGERRFRAAVLARDLLASDPKARASSRKDYDFETIPAQIYTALDTVDDHRTEIQLIENIQRADMQPEEIGHALHKLVDGRYKTEHAVAKALGMNVALVQRLCKLVSAEGQAVLKKWPGTEATTVYKICGMQPGGSSPDAKYWDLGVTEYLESRAGKPIYRGGLAAAIAQIKAKEAGAELAERESAVTSTNTGQVPVAAGEVSGDALPDADLYADTDTDTGSGHAAIFDAGGDAVGDGLVHSLTPPTAQDLADRKNRDATGPRTVPTDATLEEEICFNKMLQDFGVVAEGTRFNAFTVSPETGDVSADMSDVLCDQSIAVSMTLNTAQTFELAGWLTDWLKELKEQEKQHGIDKDTTVKDIPITVRLAVSPSDAVALTKLASGDAVNALSMTPAVLREALMQIVKS